jgi:hypothetical protein
MQGLAAALCASAPAVSIALLQAAFEIGYVITLMVSSRALWPIAGALSWILADLTIKNSTVPV